MKTEIFDDSMTVGTVSNLHEDGSGLDGEVLTRHGIVQARSKFDGTYLRFCSRGRLFIRSIKKQYYTARGLSRIAATFAKEKSK